jgi:hypothetical protein
LQFWNGFSAVNCRKFIWTVPLIKHRHHIYIAEKWFQKYSYFQSLFYLKNARRTAAAAAAAAAAATR